jgi:hypothetical protein
MILENPRQTSRCATGKGALIILQGYKAAAAAVLEDVVQKAWRKVLRTMEDDCKVCTSTYSRAAFLAKSLACAAAVHGCTIRIAKCLFHDRASRVVVIFDLQVGEALESSISHSSRRLRRPRDATETAGRGEYKVERSPIHMPVSTFVAYRYPRALKLRQDPVNIS